MINKVTNKFAEIGVFPFMIWAFRGTWMRIVHFLITLLFAAIGWAILLLKPIIFIRFGSLHSEKIGPFAAQTELYLCEKQLGIQPKNAFDIFVSSHITFSCNRQLHTMWKRLLRVNDRFRSIYNIIRLNARYTEHVIETTNASRDLHGLLERTEVHLRFTDHEEERAKIDLARMGISEDDEYVLMINRGQRYLNEMFPERDWKYHEWRNIGIENFMSAAEMLTSRGHYVIRVGHLVSDLMNTSNPAIIEYDEHGYRTELLDLYLPANCRFYFGIDTGYEGLPLHVFRKPVVQIYNQLEDIAPYLSTTLTIFSRYWLESEERFMRVPDILSTGVGRPHGGEDFDNAGIEVVKNTPEEIVDVVVEMEERLDGTWETTNEDEELQRVFWDHFKVSSQFNPDGKIRGRIGAKFLRQNLDLFV